ncbi:MAG: ribonuclease HII [Candidatus Paceibacterota bacterium]|jgi:ribonuclease HII
MKANKIIIGVDEVGRGPIAGPVAVGAFVFLDKNAQRVFRGAKESKQLSERKREEWFEKILKAKSAGRIDFKVSFESEKVIDFKGLSFAIKRALGNSLRALKINSKQAMVLLDGGLKAPAIYEDQQTIIKGDEKKLVIALASICAKVLRDRRMINLSKKHVEYGFEKHKGYGTAKHYSAIKSLGLLPCHRRSFLKNNKKGQ